MSSPNATDMPALGGPIDERTPLYSRLADLAAEHPGEPLPEQGEGVLGPYPERLEPIRPVEADGDPDTTRADEWLAPRLTRSLRWFLAESPRDREALRLLYTELVGIGDWAARAAVNALAPFDDPGPARILGRWLCRYAADRGPIKAGLQLLAGTADGEPGSEPAEQERLLTTLALADGEFTSAALTVLTKTSPDAEAAIFAVARRLDGWGLLAAISALKDTTNPVIKRWMVRDVSFWGLVYCCDTLAGTGDLLGALRDGPVDDKLLDNAGNILRQLCDRSTQTARIDSYRDGRATLAAYRRRLAERGPDLNRLWYLTCVEESVREGLAAGLDWDPGERESLLAGFGALLADPAWTGVIAAELSNPDSNRRVLASQCAVRIGFDVIDGRLVRQRDEP